MVSWSLSAMCASTLSMLGVSRSFGARSQRLPTPRPGGIQASGAGGPMSVSVPSEATCTSRSRNATPSMVAPVAKVVWVS